MVRAATRDWPAIRLTVLPSWGVSCLVALPYGLGGVSIACLPWPLSPRVVVIGGLAMMACRTIREQGLRTGHGAIRGLEWDGGGRWWVDGVGQGRHEVRLVGTGFVHPALVVIGLDGPGRRSRPLILCAGNTDADGLRRLRVRLLLGRASRRTGPRRPPPSGAAGDR